MCFPGPYADGQVDLRAELLYCGRGATGAASAHPAVTSTTAVKRTCDHICPAVVVLTAESSRRLNCAGDAQNFLKKPVRAEGRQFAVRWHGRVGSPTVVRYVMWLLTLIMWFLVLTLNLVCG
eukprot:SAG31_NODE_552_length_14204_cov_14.295356_4_plen_122_part_00